MKNIIACIQVSLQSKRLPNKALLKIEGIPSILHLIRRLKRSHFVSENICLCISDQKLDDPLEEVGLQEDIYVVRGDKYDCMGRMISALDLFEKNFRKKISHIVRVTGDDIILDWEFMDSVLKSVLKNKEITHEKAGLIKGTDFEVFESKKFRKVYQSLSEDQRHNSEYLTNFFEKIPYHFFSNLEFTLDTENDLKNIKKLFKKMRPNLFFKTSEIFEKYP